MLIAPGIIYSIINIDASVESEENTIDQMWFKYEEIVTNSIYFF
jgi:hypothetical protein